MEKVKTKLQSLILIGYSLIIFYLISTGLFIKFIHPRMQIYTFICAVFIFILALVDINKSSEDNKVHISNIVYLLPLVLIFYINGGNFSNKMLDSKSNNVLLKEKSNENSIQNNTSNSISNTTSNLNANNSQLNNDQQNDAISDNNTVSNNTDYSDLEDSQNAQYDQKNTQYYITKDQNPNSDNKVNGFDFYFTDKNYLDNLMLISENVDKYIGKTVSFDGFIYRDNTMSSDQFVVGRLGIWCCIADASLSGFLCTSKDSQKYIENDWYRVEGTLDKTNSKDAYTGKYYVCPYVHVTKMQKIDKPDNEYVYPN